ncbi:UNVERIFIED_CONTAM: hypothetical protein GTU68_007332 [Idotea baltica]|nr:hypothetical protein [Idotea baltica]
MYANQIENLDAIKLLKVLLYTHKILKKYNYLNVKFLTRNVRYLNIKSFQKVVYGNQDHNATLIIPFKLALRLSLAPGCWVSAKFLSRDFNHRQTQLRWIKVIIDYKLKSSDQCFVSLNLYHNLKEALSSQNIAVELKSDALIFNIYLITRLFAIWNSRGGRRNIFSKYKSNLLPKFTSEVNLSFAHPSNLNSKEVENILQYHFSIPRYLHKQDIICIPIPPLQNLPSEMSESLAQAEYLYFIVNSFDESGQSPTSGYLVSKEKTALFLSGVKSTRIPYLMGNANTADENTIPCLKSVFNKVCSIFESSQPLWSKEYTKLKTNLNEDEKLQIVRERQEESKDSRNRRNNSKNSLFDYNGQLLLIGPPGSGKVKLIKMLAEKFSYQIKWIDCLSLKGDTSSSTEGKINIAFSNLPPYTIIVLTRIGSLSEDRDGHNDPRAFSALREI